MKRLRLARNALETVSERSIRKDCNTVKTHSDLHEGYNQSPLAMEAGWLLQDTWSL